LRPDEKPCNEANIFYASMNVTIRDGKKAPCQVSPWIFG
jgi:hypothetical protein